MIGCRQMATYWRQQTASFPIGNNRWASLVVACTSMAAAGAIYQNTWQNAMREILRQTELEANLVSTLGIIGAMLALPAGLVYEVFNAQMMGLIGGLLAVVGYGLLSLATWQWRLFFGQHLWLVDTIYFFVGLSFTFIYMSGILSNVENFPYHRHGIVIGTLDACQSVGPTLFTILYNLAFTNGHIQAGEEGRQNLSGYFLTVGIISIFVNIATFMFVGKIQSRAREQSAVDLVPLIASRRFEHENEADDNNFTGEERAPSVFSEYPFTVLPIASIFQRWSFHFLLIQFSLIGSVQLTYQANIPTYLRSLNMNQHNLLFTALFTAAQSVAKLAFGFLSDSLSQSGKWPRSIFLTVAYTFQTACLFLSAFLADKFIVQFATCLTVSITTGITWCLTPALLAELYGSKHLGTTWGLLHLVIAVFIVPSTTIFSTLYQVAIPKQDEIYCYGTKCFFWSFILFAACSLFAFITVIKLTQNMLGNAKKRRR